MDNRIAVTPAELARAIRVWLRVMPKHIWEALRRHELAALEKRQNPDETPQVHAAVADHIVGQLERARWDVTRPEPPADLGSPPPWRREGTDSQRAKAAPASPRLHPPPRGPRRGRSLS